MSKVRNSFLNVKKCTVLLWTTLVSLISGKQTMKNSLVKSLLLRLFHIMHGFKPILDCASLGDVQNLML